MTYARYKADMERLELLDDIEFGAVLKKTLTAGFAGLGGGGGPIPDIDRDALIDDLARRLGRSDCVHLRLDGYCEMCDSNLGRDAERNRQ